MCNFAVVAWEDKIFAQGAFKATFMPPWREEEEQINKKLKSYIRFHTIVVHGSREALKN